MGQLGTSLRAYAQNYNTRGAVQEEEYTQQQTHREMHEDLRDRRSKPAEREALYCREKSNLEICSPIIFPHCTPPPCLARLRLTEACMHAPLAASLCTVTDTDRCDVMQKRPKRHGTA